MAATPRPLALAPHRRLAAWVVCGPLGHLYGGVADWLELLLRYWWSKARK